MMLAELVTFSVVITGILTFHITRDRTKDSPITLIAKDCLQFGTDDNGGQRTTWSIENKSADEIEVSSVSTNCGCTVVTHAPKWIGPGSSVELTTERSYKSYDQSQSEYRSIVFFRTRNTAQSGSGTVLQSLSNSVPTHLLTRDSL